jgi:hypothetical protein
MVLDLKQIEHCKSRLGEQLMSKLYQGVPVSDIPESEWQARKDSLTTTMDISNFKHCYKKLQESLKASAPSPQVMQPPPQVVQPPPQVIQPPPQVVQPPPQVVQPPPQVMQPPPQVVQPPPQVVQPPPQVMQPPPQVIQPPPQVMQPPPQVMQQKQQEQKQVQDMLLASVMKEASTTGEPLLKVLSSYIPTEYVSRFKNQVLDAATKVSMKDISRGLEDVRKGILGSELYKKCSQGKPATEQEIKQAAAKNKLDPRVLPEVCDMKTSATTQSKLLTLGKTVGNQAKQKMMEAMDTSRPSTRFTVLILGLIVLASIYLSFQRALPSGTPYFDEFNRNIDTLKNEINECQQNPDSYCSLSSQQLEWTVYDETNRIDVNKWNWQDISKVRAWAKPQLSAVEDVIESSKLTNAPNFYRDKLVETRDLLKHWVDVVPAKVEFNPRSNHPQASTYATLMYRIQYNLHDNDKLCATKVGNDHASSSAVQAFLLASKYATDMIDQYDNPEFQQLMQELRDHINVHVMPAAEACPTFRITVNLLEHLQDIMRNDSEFVQSMYKAQSKKDREWNSIMERWTFGDLLDNVDIRSRQQQPPTQQQPPQQPSQQQQPPTEEDVPEQVVGDTRVKLNTKGRYVALDRDAGCSSIEQLSSDECKLKFVQALPISQVIRKTKYTDNNRVNINEVCSTLNTMFEGFDDFKKITRTTEHSELRRDFLKKLTLLTHSDKIGELLTADESKACASANQTGCPEWFKRVTDFNQVVAPHELYRNKNDFEQMRRQCSS